MKKFCSKCGAQLDLGKKTCTACNAFNPFFIAGFTSFEAEPVIEKVTPVNDAGQDWKKENAAGIERLRAEHVEQQKAELELKSQLLKVKEETEQLKKDTFNMVEGVQKELHDIEKENKLLKERVEQLNHSSLKQPENTLRNTVTEPKTEGKNRFTVIAAVLLLLVVTGLSYYFFSSSNKKSAAGATQKIIQLPPAQTAPAIEGKQVAQKPANTETVRVKKLLALATQPAISKPAAEAFVLTPSKLRADLVGKTLSGCDITIKNSAEVIKVGKVILVDKLSASYLKYKCTIQIIQTGNVYTSTSYIYYSSDGSFIKVDGTTCE